jgi:hypothetical protein
MLILNQALAFAEHFNLVADPDDSNPSLGSVMLLVFSAILEVVCICLPGYILARLGRLDADKQKFLGNLNILLFTPCLGTFASRLLFPSSPSPLD